MTPYFDTLADFIVMGGHGFYVWLCWGIVVGSVIFGLIYSRLERKKTLRQLKIAQARKQQQKIAKS